LAAATRAFAQSLKEVDPLIPVSAMQPIEERIGSSVALPRLYATLVGIFAGAALFLAALGVYGVMAYSVAARTREIGVRVALGARPTNVFGMVVRQGLGTAVAGLTVGLLAAAALGRLLTKLLYGVTPTDTATFVGVTAVLLAVVLAACLVPARRAVRIDPLEALRSE
jgi:putative ABC transport system permease protein